MENKLLTFQLVNLFKRKKNALYIESDALQGNGNFVILEIENYLRDKQYLHWNEAGNVNEENYTFSLTFMPGILDPTRTKEVQLTSNAALNWRSYYDESSCTLYLLANNKDIVHKVRAKDGLQKIPIAIQGIYVSPKSATITNVLLNSRYHKVDEITKATEAPTVYQSQIPVDVLSHVGLQESPFKFVVDTAVLNVASKKQELKMRLVCLPSSLNLSRLRLQISFDVYEPSLKSPHALMAKNEFDARQFTAELSIKKNNHKKSIQISNGATEFSGIVDYNINSEKFTGLNNVKRLTEVEVTIRGFEPLALPGSSQIKIRYFNVDGYWDGELETCIRRSALYEERVQEVVEVQPKLVNTLEADSITVAGELKDRFGALLPKGSILMWSGTTPPAGWVICNGKNGTPDLRGRFILGSSNKYISGKKYGNNKIEVENLPPHKHNVQFNGSEKSWVRNLQLMEDTTYPRNFKEGGYTGYDSCGVHPKRYIYENVVKYLETNDGEGLLNRDFLPKSVALNFIMKR